MFKFEAMWLSNDESGSVVAETWASSIGEKAAQ